MHWINEMWSASIQKSPLYNHLKGKMHYFVPVISCLRRWFRINYHFWKFGNCPIKMRAISKFSKITMLIYSKNCTNQTCDYWLIIPNQQTLILKLTSSNSVQLQISECAIAKRVCNCELQLQLQEEAINL